MIELKDIGRWVLDMLAFSLSKLDGVGMNLNFKT